MDAPGFPEGPESPMIKVLLWGLLVLVVLVSVAVTVIAARRGPRRPAVIGIGAVLLVLAMVAYLLMLLPSYVFGSAGGGGTCPIDAMDLAFMRGAKASEFYAYWQDCRNASRRTIALALGGYALLAGIGGIVQLRISRPVDTDIDVKLSTRDKMGA